MDEWLDEHGLSFAQYEETFQGTTSEKQEPQALPQSEEVLAPTVDIPLLERPIDYCKFCAHTYNSLVAAEIETVGDLTQMRRIDIENLCNLGQKSVVEVEEWLTAHNLSLSENIPGPYVNTRHRKKRTRK